MATLLSPSASVARSRRFVTYRTGQCLNFVSNVMTNGKMLGVPAPYALHAWSGAKWKHTDRKPPAGVPVWFNHGTSNKYGHICLSLGGGKIRSTDWPARGRVGETTITELERRWNRKYVGWAEDLYGSRVPGFPVPTARVRVPYPGRQRFGSKGSNVRLIQQRLKALGYNVAVDGSFGPMTLAAVKDFQRKQRITVDGKVGPVTWGRLGIYR